MHNYTWKTYYIQLIFSLVGYEWYSQVMYTFPIYSTTVNGDFDREGASHAPMFLPFQWPEVKEPWRQIWLIAGYHDDKFVNMKTAPAFRSWSGMYAPTWRRWKAFDGENEPAALGGKGPGFSVHRAVSQPLESKTNFYTKIWEPSNGAKLSERRTWRLWQLEATSP